MIHKMLYCYRVTERPIAVVLYYDTPTLAFGASFGITHIRHMLRIIVIMKPNESGQPQVMTMTLLKSPSLQRSIDVTEK